MERGYTFYYDTQANDSYLVISPEEGTPVIPYEMKMLENNRIEHLLPARKYSRDGAIRVCYSVTGYVALEQVLRREKLRREDVLTLLSTIAAAYAELVEYQLPAGGLLLNEESIFVKPGSFLPKLVYLPASAEENGAESLRSFVRGLVLESRIIAAGDDFVQRLLDAVNDPMLTPERLRERLREMETVSAPAAAPVPPVFEPIPAAQPSPIDSPPPAPAREKKEPPAGTGGSGKKPPAPKKAGSSKSSVFFTLVQGLLVVLLALGFKKGVFMSGGGLNPRYLLGALIAAAGLDTVLYRELFINHADGKAPKEKAPKKDKKAGKGGKAAHPLPQRPGESRPAAPAPQPVYEPVSAAPASQPVYEPIPVAAAYIPRQGGAAPEEATVLLDDNGGNGAGYLEYYENGLAMRIHLKEGATLVGSRAQSVDHVLSSHKVSKLHAEFICQGGEYFVRDINSTNGTYLNGAPQRLVSNQAVPLHNGDRVRLADTELVFKC